MSGKQELSTGNGERRERRVYSSRTWLGLMYSTSMAHLFLAVGMIDPIVWSGFCVSMFAMWQGRYYATDKLIVDGK